MLANLLLIPALLAPSPDLPAAVRAELKRVEEMYRVLDFAAQKIWPGWDDYRSTPFLFEYENGLRVLIGHPKPPSEFTLVPDAKVETKAVFADFTHVSGKAITGRQRAGGGPIPFGEGPDGRPMQVISLRFSPLGSSGEDGMGERAEQQMLVYIHELFHCFQRVKLERKLYGNLRYNPDTTYAVYSEIEGLALQRALEAGGDTAKVRQYLGDFVAARTKKLSESMSEMQANQERWEEFVEGAATYAELRTLDLLRAGGFEPKLQGDAEYSGFSDPSSLSKVYADRMRKAISNSKYALLRVYYYGAAQALLLDRLFPGWQKDVEFFDQEIQRRMPASAPARLEAEYDVPGITGRYAAELGARDAAYRLIQSRSGRVYVIDFKKVSRPVNGTARPAKVYQLGLITLWPEGAGTLSFDDVEVSGLSVPSLSDQLYYVRAVDTSGAREKTWSVEGAAQPDGTYRRAVVRTPVFTLKAPHVRVIETGDAVKIQVLARVCEGSCASQ
ncbi:hypothetical protein [uncultured Paludibaculum sp.]|uniref:hypothetical protein n=1 Tax=uncultured Paludibaculum sp. TaxID=1765020 RepID=UPI002AAA77D7|nr:hypothetical protein [uncultured Paludibaculum sp.]